MRDEAEELKVLLTTIHKKGMNGATLSEVMSVLKKELPKITRQQEYSVK